MSNEMMIFEGKAVNLYVMVSLKHGLKLYAKTGMRPNRAWTATAMLRKASEFTGKNYKRSQHAQAADDLESILQQIREAA